MIKDMTAGSPIKLIMTFAVPVLIGNIFQQLYNISDILIVGRLLGVEALAAVGVSAPIFMVLLMIAFGFTGGLTVITAQRFGAKDVSGVRASVVHSLIASTILSLAMTGLTLFYLPQILHLMNVPENIWDNAYRFLFVLCSGLVLVVTALFSDFFNGAQCAAESGFGLFYGARRRRFGFGNADGDDYFGRFMRDLYRPEVSDTAFAAYGLGL